MEMDHDRGWLDPAVLVFLLPILALTSIGWLYVLMTAFSIMGKLCDLANKRYCSNPALKKRRRNQLIDGNRGILLCRGRLRCRGNNPRRNRD